MRLEVISRRPTSTPRQTPLLFVHGAWHGAWAWDEYFLPYFAQHGYHAHALSLRGHGESQGRERIRWHRISHYVTDVKQVADTLPVPPVVIGHSMGGFVVQKYLEKHPAPAAVLIASAPPAGVLRAALNLAIRHPLTFLKLNVQLRLYPAVETPALARELLFTGNTPDGTVNRTFPRLQDESYLGFLDMMLLNLPRPEHVQTPMLVIGADKDRLFNQNEVNATARAYNTAPIMVADTGHDMMVEATWQTTADHILRWLVERKL